MFKSWFNLLINNNKVGALIEYLILIFAILLLISSVNPNYVIVLILLDLVVKFVRKGL